MIKVLNNSPLYIQVMNTIKEKIISGQYKVGCFIPTESELEDQFDVSKITIRKAIELLESEGYVSKKSGKGTTVISNSIFNKLSKAESFSSILTSEGHDLKKDITDVKVITNEPNTELHSYFGSQCLKITRVYSLNDIPYIYFEHYIPNKLDFEGNKLDNSTSLYMLLYKNQLYISNFQDDFFIDFPEKDILEKLNLSSGPVLSRKRKSIDNNNNVIEVSYAKYNTNVHNYVIKYEI